MNGQGSSRKRGRRSVCVLLVPKQGTPTVATVVPPPYVGEDRWGGR
jgi:hypothetical protein